MYSTYNKRKKPQVSIETTDLIDNKGNYSNPSYINILYEKGYINEDTFIPQSVGTYILNKNLQVLLVKNKHGLWKGMWSGVGGWVDNDKGEYPYEGILREIGEENNILNTMDEWTKKLWVLGIRDIILEKKPTRLYVMFYSGDDNFFDIKDNNEILDWKWMDVYDFIYDVSQNRYSYRPFVSRDINFIQKIIKKTIHIFEKKKYVPNTDRKPICIDSSLIPVNKI